MPPPPPRPRPNRRPRQAAPRVAFLRAIATTAVFATAASTRWLLLAGATATGPAGARRGGALVFRVEGRPDDPEFARACGVVRGLEDLYGKERYLLQPVPVEDGGSSHDQEQRRASPRRRRPWIPRWFGGSAGRRKQSPQGGPAGETAPRSAVLCSIDRAPADDKTQAQGPAAGGHLSAAEESPAAVANTRVAIGGVDELLEFVRTSVLAGPRPFSFAFHEQSLGIQAAHRRKQRDESSALAAAVAAPPRRRKLLRLGSGRRRRRSTSSLKHGAPGGAPSPSGSAGAPPPGGGGGGASGVSPSEYDYDLVVIGGGSGGLACAKEAARLGKKVACLDFVKPSVMGSKWGLGGTCVNVGCIPKKLMHQAALLAGHAKDAPFFGWPAGPEGEDGSRLEEAGGVAGGEGKRSVTHDWEVMVQGVQNYIKGLNFKYRTDLRSKGVEYINALGRLQDAHTVVATDKNNKERVLSCGSVVVAVGGRPNQLPCEGGELAMTSDDIFALRTPPGKTLVVGASYVALECAGFLTGLGVDTTVMVRSILLRGFDQGIAERIGSFMEAEGTRFLRPAVPQRISKTEQGRLLVRWREGEGDDQTTKEEEFDTVLAATGRRADTQGLGLERLGVTLSNNGKMVCRNEETTVAGVFGIGDAVEGVPELTPSAVQAGRLLAMRLFGGEENVEVFHSAFTPLEWQMNSERPQNACYVKAVCDLTDSQRVVGLHFLGPNAGEVMQGFGVGIRLGMTMDDLRQLVGIHPTVAEELTLLQTTKRSGEPIEKSAC
ncbi:Thioredoxin reductase [Ectocarpus siliculosus]|uniref:Thioredoxin reductase n=1 Tax=Ectocarpus siliculosus TaxID=2880 RepID=D8LJA3_ECTSI|nr:Thioredoxin reductase [Ectocarpus siliculosus]|eukprot:CBN76987.1 Thioredoxin reductase [Ectocarpus siliculosus]